MRPISQFDLHKKTGMNIRKDVILDVVGNSSCKVQWLLDLCMKIKLGSQATIHREIHELVKARYISAKTDYKDGRVVNLKINKKGQEYLDRL